MSGLLKAIIVVVALGLVGVISIAIFLFSIFNKSMGPEKARQVANEILQIDQPLPAGWHFVMGGSKKNLLLNNAANGALVFISEARNSQHKTAKQLAVLSAKSEPNVVWTKESEGETTIGGLKGFYIRAHSSNSAEERIFVVLPDDRYVLIETVESKSTFEPSVSKPLLECIKGFRKSKPVKSCFYAFRELKVGMPISKESVSSIFLESNSDSPLSDCEMSLENIVGRKPTVTIQTGRVLCKCEFMPKKSSKSSIKTVVYATRDIGEGALLTSDAMRETTFQSDQIPVDALNVKQDAIGWAAKYGLSKDTIVSTHDLTPIEEALP